MQFEAFINLLKSAKNPEIIDAHREEIAEWIPHVRRMFEYDQQNAAHQYDLWMHCVHTVVGIPRNLEDDMLYLAALLHDITKELSVEEHIALMKKYGIEATDEDISSPQLLHSKTAELLAKDKYPEFATKRICQALRYHTTGSADMTLFDAIIYIADYIEDGRDNEFCLKLRNYFWSAEPHAMSMPERERHLWKTMLFSLDMTVENITARGGIVDKQTLLARDAVKDKLAIEK